jgi:hypothetical protein
MTDRAKIAVVFLEYVEYGLPECHHCACKPNHRGSWILGHMRKIHVENIKSDLYEIHDSYVKTTTITELAHQGTTTVTRNLP